MGRGALLGEAYVKVSFADLEKLGITVDKVGQKFNKNFDDMAKHANRLDKEWLSINKTADNSANAFNRLGGIIATIGIAKFGSEVIGAATKMDNMNRMLINVEGSQSAANKRFEQFRILAKEPILDPFNLSRFYVSLKSVNVEGELSIKFMKSLANAMNNVGAGNEQFVRAMEQFTQMVGKEKLASDDLRTIAESFPQIRKYLSEAFGTSNPEELAKRGISAIEVMTKLNEVMEKAPRVIGSAQAAQDNFRQSLELFYAGLSKNLLPEFTKFLSKTTEVMDTFGKLPDKTKSAIGDFAMGGAGILGLAFAAKTLGIELSGVALAISKNPLLQAALLGYIGGASISKFIPIPGLDEKKGIEAIPRTKEQQASNRLGMLGYELDAMRAVRSGIGTNLLSSIAEKPLTKAEYDEFMKSYSENQFPYTVDLSKGRAGTGEPYTVNPYEIPTSYGSLATPYFQGQYAQPLPSEIRLSNMQAMMGYHPQSEITTMTGGMSAMERDRAMMGQKGKSLADYQKVIDGWSTGIDNFGNQWDDLWAETERGLKDVDTNMKMTLEGWIALIDQGYTLIMGALDNLGLADEDSKTAKQIGGVLSGAGQGAVTGATIGSIIPGLGTGAGAVIGGIIGGIGGYEEMAEGGSGIVTKPTLFLAGEAGPEPYWFGGSNGNRGRSGIGGTHVEIHNINLPSGIDRQQAENLVVQAYNDAVRHGRLN